MRLLISLTSLVAFALASACDDKGNSTTADYRSLLTDATDRVLLPAFGAVVTEADALVSALQALETTPSEATLAAAQASWRSARSAYRALDGARFGPVDELGIADRIDVAPADNTAIEAAVADSATIDAARIAAAGGHAKGYLAVEALIFSSDGASAALARLQGDGAPVRRRLYARVVAQEIASSVHELQDAWTTTYADAIKKAGAGSERYATQRAALDDLVGGVAFGLELVVGVRLAQPLGRKTTGNPDPSADPTAASDSAQADMLSTLTGIQNLYEGEGFSAKVKAKSEVLDARCKEQLAACIAKIQVIPAPFVTSVSAHTATVQEAYDACKALKTTWNTDVTSALGATLKPADNDGD